MVKINPFTGQPEFAKDGGSAKIIIASRAGCALNSNVLTGGGTDDTVALQAALDLLESSGGGELVLDGAALISRATVTGSQYSALALPSNVTIRALSKACGAFLAAGSNCLMVSNKGITGNPAATFSKNHRIIGGTWNGNAANQSRYEVGSSGGWVFGMWFGGFDGLLLEDVTVLGAKCFGIVLSNGRNGLLRDSESRWIDDITGTSNKDGIHLYGTLDNVFIYNHFVNGDDDSIAYNTDEGVMSYLSSEGIFGRDRYPWSGGGITNVFVDGLLLAGTAGNHVARFYGTGSGTTTLDNIWMRNIRGVTQAGIEDGGSTSGLISITGWNIAQDLAFTATTAVLNDIKPGTAVSVTATNKIGNYFDDDSGGGGGGGGGGGTTTLIAEYLLGEASGDRADTAGSFTMVDNGGVGSGTGKVGNCAVFDGTNFLQNSSLSTALAAGVSFLVTAWVKPDALSAYQAVVACMDGYDPNALFFFGLTAGGNIHFDLTNGSGTGFTNDSDDAVAADGSWYFIAARYDAGAGQSFTSVNGGIETAQSVAATNPSPINPVRIGSMESTADGGDILLPFSGSIDQVRIYTGVTGQAAQITADYNAGAGR